MLKSLNPNAAGNPLFRPTLFVHLFEMGGVYLFAESFIAYFVFKIMARNMYTNCKVIAAKIKICITVET